MIKCFEIVDWCLKTLLIWELKHITLLPTVTSSAINPTSNWLQIKHYIIGGFQYRVLRLFDWHFSFPSIHFFLIQLLIISFSVHLLVELIIQLLKGLSLLLIELGLLLLLHLLDLLRHKWFALEFRLVVLLVSLVLIEELLVLEGLFHLWRKQIRCAWSLQIPLFIVHSWLHLKLHLLDLLLQIILVAFYLCSIRCLLY
jgi:hypothetical protein